MITANLLIVCLISNAIAIENRKKPLENKLGYDPSELLANIFSSSETTPKHAHHKLVKNEFVEDINPEIKETLNQSNKVNFQDNDHLGAYSSEQNLTENENVVLKINKEQTEYHEINNSNDGEFRSNFKKRNPKKRKPRVQSDYDQRYPDTQFFANQYGLIPESYPQSISPNELGLAAYGLYDPEYYPYGAGDQYPGGYTANAFIPKQLSSDAFSAIVGAFTSIAQNDDYQCVPRLLCETAGGAAGSRNILNSLSNLQPLLTMLTNYQGLGTSPLFLFGRAVFLGMTSKDNPSSCHSAYPQCPTDPDELVHYLNNHKGGFFRFFSSVKRKPSGLIGNYQKYGNRRPNGHEKNGLYDGRREYGGKYGYSKENDIKEVASARIQNKPAKEFNNNFDYKTKWLFPGDVSYNDDIKVGNKLKFPSNGDNNFGDDFNAGHKYNRKGKKITFPEKNNDQLFDNDYYFNKYSEKENDYTFDYVHNFYVKREKKKVDSPEEDTLKTVYIVRGNGDPRYPEVVKLRPGQSIQ